MFDGVLHPDTYHSQSLPSFLRQPSPSGSSVNGSHLEPPMSYDALAQQNTMLRTRVSELEVINGLFQGRVRELENGEEEARRMDLMTRATEAQLRAELEEVRQRESSLKRRLEEIEVEPSHKKMRLSDMVDESRAGTPIGSLEESS
jgi:GATA-binding protein